MAVCPPMFTVTADFALGTLPPVSIWPVAAAPSSAPKPAQKSVIELPAAAPLPVPFAVKSLFRIQACPLPEPSAVNVQSHGGFSFALQTHFRLNSN